MRCTASPPPTWPPAAPAHPGIGTSTRCRSPTCSWRCAGSSSPPNICQVRWSSPLQQKSSRCSVPGQPPQHEPRKSRQRLPSLYRQTCKELLATGRPSRRSFGTSELLQALIELPENLVLLVKRLFVRPGAHAPFD